jgi:hypothetical protein
VQEARTVVLCGYTYENVGLMFLSRDSRYPDGLGNNAGRLGRHLMTKMWADVFGFFSDTVFNGHTGPAAQMWGMDDFMVADFDAPSHGFVGGATPNVENQRLEGARLPREARLRVGPVPRGTATPHHNGRVRPSESPCKGLRFDTQALVSYRVP